MNDKEHMMRITQTEPSVTTLSWQLAFDPAYSLVPDERIYAGFIFRLVDEHAQRIDIPNEQDAIQVVIWLNEREQLLAQQQEAAHI
jgi:hypothetical protein